MHTFRADGTIMLPVGCRPPRFGDPDDDSDDDPDDDERFLELSTFDEDRTSAAAARARVALLTVRPPSHADRRNT